MYRFFIFLGLSIIVISSSCSEKKVKKLADIKIYTGPVALAENIETIYSDSGRLKLVVKAPLQTEFQTGDREFPKGILIDFYDDKGIKTTHLTGNYARYDKQAGIYFATGNVIVENFVEKQKLQSEELKFNHLEKRIYTDKFVRITTEVDILTGTGLTASQDFSTYKILKPQAIVSRMK